jgi:predicted nucleotidyltransferase
MNNAITNRLHSLAEALAADPDIDVVYLFGSVARGRVSPLSDIDIGILLGGHVPEAEHFHRRLKYIGLCADILRADRVDVVILNKAPLVLAYEVVSPQKVLVERNREHRVAFEASTVMKYLDFKPVLNVQVEYTKRHLEMGTYFD